MFKRKKKSLVSKAKEGEKDAFIQLIEENIVSVYRVAKGILEHEEDIEDAIQNMILLAYKNINSLKKEEFFKTWLIRILINECNKIYNFNKRFINVKDIREVHSEDKYEDVDLKNAVDNLSEDLRLPIVLYYYEELKLSEISEVMGIPQGTVKSRLSRGREALAKILGNKEVM